jgi:hypothetical protein
VSSLLHKLLHSTLGTVFTDLGKLALVPPMALSLAEALLKAGMVLYVLIKRPAITTRAVTAKSEWTASLPWVHGTKIGDSRSSLLGEVQRLFWPARLRALSRQIYMLRWICLVGLTGVERSSCLYNDLRCDSLFP